MLKSFILLAHLCLLAHCYFQPPVFFDNKVRDLYGNATADMIMMAQEWTVYHGPSSSFPAHKVGFCNGNPVLGGPNVQAGWGYFERRYSSIPRHSILYFNIGVKMIGDWKGNLTLRFDGSIVNSFSVKEIGVLDGSNSCGNAGKDLDARLLGKVLHKAWGVTVRLEWSSHSNPDASFAIYDLILRGEERVESDDYPVSAITLMDTIQDDDFANWTLKTVKTNCKAGFYRSGNTCLRCDTGCELCFGPSSSQCYQHSWGLAPEGRKCPSNCQYCPYGSHCSLCDPGYMVDLDGSCKSESVGCQNPQFVKRSNEDITTSASVKECGRICEPGTYMYWNRTCGLCNAPLIQTMSGDARVCVSPCSTDEYLYPNGTCSDSCIYTPTNETGYSFCLPEVQDYLSQNGSTVELCPYPYKIGWDDRWLCNAPCSPESSLFWNQTCVICEAPWVKQIKNGVTYCVSPCLEYQYVTRDGRCLDECPDSLHGGDLLYCLNPPNTTSDKACSLNQYEYSDGSCLSVCYIPNESQIRKGSKFCLSPCYNQYLSLLHGTCLDTCNFPTIRAEEQGITYCDDKNGKPNGDFDKTVPCVPFLEFRYANDSCLDLCNCPHTASWRNGELVCSVPCPNRYYSSLNKTCVDTCEERFTKVEGEIKYCDERLGCPSIDDFKYPNGSCLPECLSPWVESWQNGTNFCSPPCPSGYYYSIQNEICYDLCESEFIRIEDDIAYCDGSNEPENSNGCPSSWFKYSDDSCVDTCSYPDEPELRNGSRFCSAPCPGQYWSTLHATCVDTCEERFILPGRAVVYCDDKSGETSPPSKYPKKCKNKNEFIYSNGSCLQSCSCPHYAGWSETGALACYNPCPDQYYSPLNGACVDTCEIKYLKAEGDIIYCDERSNPSVTNSTSGSYSASLEIFIRYDVSLSDFTAKNYLAKFTALLAEIFGVNPENIIIIRIREGSTIIDSRVVLTSPTDSASVAATNSQIKTMQVKFEYAGSSNKLGFDGISALNYKSSIVTSYPEQIESSSKGLAIGLGVGLGLLALAIVGYAVYRHKRKLKIMRVKEGKPISTERVEGNVNATEKKAGDDQRKDEERCSLAQNSVIQVPENMENNLSKHQEKDERVFFTRETNNQMPKVGQGNGEQGSQQIISNGQVINQQEEQVRNESQKPISLNKLMKEVDDILQV